MAKRAFGSSGGVQEPTAIYLVMILSRRHRRHVTSGTILYVRIAFVENSENSVPDPDKAASIGGACSRAVQKISTNVMD